MAKIVDAALQKGLNVVIKDHAEDYVYGQLHPSQGVVNISELASNHGYPSAFLGITMSKDQYLKKTKGRIEKEGRIVHFDQATRQMATLARRFPELGSFFDEAVLFNLHLQPVAVYHDSELRVYLGRDFEAFRRQAAMDWLLSQPDSTSTYIPMQQITAVTEAWKRSKEAMNGRPDPVGTTKIPTRAGSPATPELPDNKGLVTLNEAVRAGVLHHATKGRK